MVASSNVLILLPTRARPMLAEAEESDAPTPPRARSPPRYPDLCGRHRLQAEVQLLSREIGFLEEELHSVGVLQPVSVCCKEVDEYVGTVPDPLIPTCSKSKERFRAWRLLRSVACFCAIPTCCSGQCLCRPKRRSCTCKPSWHCPSTCALPCRRCCSVSCPRLRCSTPSLSCPAYSCGCVCSCSNCTKTCSCSRGWCCMS